VIAEISPFRLVAYTVGSTAVAGGISGEHTQLIGLVAGAVGAIVLAFAWLDARFDTKIKKHADDEAKLDDANMQKLEATIKAWIAERE
jgi:hypothetical protein